MRDFIPYSIPEIGEEEVAEVVDSLRSGWVTTGPKAKQFEVDFANFIGGGVIALAVNSATAGLHLALEALGVCSGDEVIIPSFTFTATAEVVRYLGATPVFVDCDPITFNINPISLKQAITDATKVVIPVHYAGLACDMKQIFDIAKQHNLRVVEDAAHALPSTSDGQLIGSLDSDATVFSFYANKTMTTGEGGMIVTKDEELANRCKVMRLHGISRDAFDRYTSNVPSWQYEVVAPGYKYNMPDIAAAIGIQQLKKLKKFQAKRELMAQHYYDSLAGLPLTLPPTPPEGELHARHIFPILIHKESNIQRDAFINSMAENGVGCSVHFIPLHLHPYWRDTYSLNPQMFPVSQSVFERVVSIPLYTKMTQLQQEKVIDVIKQVFRVS